MAQMRSFREYIAYHFENELYSAIKEFLKDGIATMRVSSRSVRCVDAAELSGITVKTVYVDDRPGMRIAFDVLVEAEIEVSEWDRHNDRYDEQTQWFKISSEGDLAHRLDDFVITNVCEYDSRGKQTAPMSDALVPIITKDQLENEAAEFLRRYYPEALDKPTAVDPITLADRMGLTVSLKHITDDFSVFGQICFTDCEAEYYDKERATFVTERVKGGTIFVDPDAYFLRNLGSVNNTIIHECVHWDKHRKAFELERLFNEEATGIKCAVAGGIKYAASRTPTEWMEWQANALTPRVQMPYTQARVKATELVQKYRLVMQTSEIIDAMQMVIDEMALFFGVSRIAAKIRMIDLGYEEAIGTFTYIDDRYVQPHIFKKGSLKRNQTFSISRADALIQATLNFELRTKIQSGDYLFIDSHFCLNSPKFITEDENSSPVLTEYARHHIDECCLIFDLTVKRGCGKDYHTECFLNRDSFSEVVFEAHFNGAANRAEVVRAYNNELADVMKKLPGNFSGSLKGLMDWKGITVEALAEASGASPKTIQRLRNEEDYKTTLATIVAICIGLKLPPVASDDLLAKAGFTLKFTEQHQMYRFLLSAYYTHSLSECNELLDEQGLDLLGGENM